jgi:hypothetical protein
MCGVGDSRLRSSSFLVPRVSEAMLGAATKLYLGNKAEREMITANGSISHTFDHPPMAKLKVPAVSRVQPGSSRCVSD